MSDPHTIIPAASADILRSETLAHVATIGPGGEPQSTPVWFTSDGSRVRISQVEGQQKLKNLRRDPRVAMSFVDPDDPGRIIEVRGRVERGKPDPTKVMPRELSLRYLGNESFAGVPGEHAMVVIVPEHVTTFDANAMG
ncbi:MAG TPA: PPOX class F420-dependent oxidoreductase [Thermomicrobiales bacterium]|nr:PPOX class F420-dependent oxidoreductase [Thermomicrobiales bacterium]